MRAAIYARCSTIKQGVEPQLAALRAFCDQRGYQVVAQFVDEAVSGTKNQRPQLDLLMHAASLKQFDTVVVFKFDRFARSVSHLHHALEAFNRAGVAFASVSEQIDTSTPAGKMIFSILGAFAEFERDLIVERGRAGISAARERLANGPYRRKKDGHLVTGLGRSKRLIDMDKVRNLLANGLSVGKTARSLNIPESTLRARLKTGG